MSILSEPRRRQRISIDPQNLQWKNDDQKFSKKLMEKMGWNEGDGLGRSRQGETDAVKLNANHTGKGLGADKMASYDSTWIGHHDDFADLLSALNKNKVDKPQTEEEKKERNEKVSMELSSRSVRRRIHRHTFLHDSIWIRALNLLSSKAVSRIDYSYQKFTRAKDTTNYSANDKSSVMGVGLKRVKDEDEIKPKEDPAYELQRMKSVIQKEANDTDTNAENGAAPQSMGELTEASNQTVSKLSVADYFAAKMALFKQKQAGKTTVKQEVKDEPANNDYQEAKQVKAEPADSEDEKHKLMNGQSMMYTYTEENSVVVKEEVDDTVEEAVKEEEESEKKRRKREKKMRKRMMLEEAVETEVVAEEVEEAVEEETSASDDERRKAKKERKRARREQREREAAELIAEQSVESGEPEKKKKKKKNKE